jgi:hypothetical protein
MKLFTTTCSAKYRNAQKYTSALTRVYLSCTGKILTLRLILHIEDLDVDGRIILDSIVTNRVAGFKLCLCQNADQRRAAVATVMNLVGHQRLGRSGVAE